MPSQTVYSLMLKKENAHHDSIYCCSWNRVGENTDKAHVKEILVTGGLDNCIKIWKLENAKLKELHKLEGHSLAVVSVAVSPDGQTLASSSLDSLLIIWDIESGKKVHEVETGPTDVWKVVFSPDGKYVLSGNPNGILHIYCVETGKQKRILDTRRQFALCVDWSPNGKYITSGSMDGSVTIFDAVQGKLLHLLEHHTSPVRNVCFSPDSKYLLSTASNGDARIYNSASGDNVGSVFGPKHCVYSACFSDDGKRIVCGTVENTVSVWKVKDCKCLFEFKEHSGAVCGVSFSPCNNKIMSVSKDKSIHIYECPVL